MSQLNVIEIKITDTEVEFTRVLEGKENTFCTGISEKYPLYKDVKINIERNSVEVKKALKYREMLKSMEWSVIADFGNNSRCPCCKGLKTEGHRMSCELYNLLK